MEKETAKKTWMCPKLIEMDIKMTENGGGWELGDIAFQSEDYTS